MLCTCDNEEREYGVGVGVKPCLFIMKRENESYREDQFMSVGLMKDYKLNLRDVQRSTLLTIGSHTLGCSVGLEHLKNLTKSTCTNLDSPVAVGGHAIGHKWFICIVQRASCIRARSVLKKFV